MLADVADLLRARSAGLAWNSTKARSCATRGTAFDMARQGYVSLMTGGGGKIDGDRPEMVAARADFLGGGSFDPLMDAVADAVVAGTGPGDDPRILEIGAGTGHYLARVLDAVPTGRGIGLDVSKSAARRIAKAHPRAGAVVADVWQRPSGAGPRAHHVLCVFAPRNADEAHRVLAGRRFWWSSPPRSGTWASSWTCSAWSGWTTGRSTSRGSDVRAIRATDRWPWSTR